MKNSAVFITLIQLAPILFFVLQIYLSRRENKWLGLILPITNFVLSLFMFFGVLLFGMARTSTQLIENGKVVKETIVSSNSITSSPMTAIGILLIFNIPTIINLIIYTICRKVPSKTSNKNNDLDKMNLHDL